VLQISNKIYCDEFLNKLEIENKILPNPYVDYPFIIVKNFLSKKLMRLIVDATQNKKNKVQAEVKVEATKGIVESKLIEKYRKTNIYELESRFHKLYQKRFLKLKPEFEKFYNVMLTQSTDIQVLEYKEGFFYVKHADDSSEIVDKINNTIGFKCVAPQRKLTTVLFATSFDEKKDDGYHFSGGELLFNYLYDEKTKQICYKPQAGDMIVFPSNPFFSHEVLKVQQGYRLSLVQWHDAIIL
jgi:SM-20-related protein